MDFMIQSESTGLNTSRTQLTLRDSDTMLNFKVELTEWQVNSAEPVRVVSGVLPEIESLIVVNVGSDPALAEAIRVLVELWPKPDPEIIEAALVDPLKALLREATSRIVADGAGGLTPIELLSVRKADYYCGTSGCGHGDNIHGLFCFAAGCECSEFERERS